MAAEIPGDAGCYLETTQRKNRAKMYPRKETIGTAKLRGYNLGAKPKGDKRCRLRLRKISGKELEKIL